MERQAREMLERHRANSQEGRSEGRHPGPTPGNPSERASHLAEAAKHLRAAGIDVSPEQLERLGHKFPSRMGDRPQGFPGGHEGNFPRRGTPAATGNVAPGGAPAMDEMRNEIRNLARQMQELRGIVQQRDGGQKSSARSGEARRDGERSRGEQDRGVSGRDSWKHRSHNGSREEHRNHSAAAGAKGEHHDGPAKSQDRDRPRGEARPPQPRGDRPAPADRPRGDAPRGE